MTISSPALGTHTRALFARSSNVPGPAISAPRHNAHTATANGGASTSATGHIPRQVAISHPTVIRCVRALMRP